MTALDRIGAVHGEINYYHEMASYRWHNRIEWLSFKSIHSQLLKNVRNMAMQRSQRDYLVLAKVYSRPVAIIYTGENILCIQVKVFVKVSGSGDRTTDRRSNRASKSH